MTSLHNDAEFKRMISNFGICMKNGPRINTNDKINRANVRSIVMPRAKKRHPITSSATHSNKGAPPGGG